MRGGCAGRIKPPTMACGRPVVATKSRAEAYKTGSPALGGALRCGGSVPNRSNEREVALCAVASSGLRPSQASIRLRRLPTVPVEGASRCALRASSSKTLHAGLKKPLWGVAIDRHRR